SGLAHMPGTSFPNQYKDHFFLCNFEGEFDNTQVIAFAVAPRGASYSLARQENFVEQGIVATDCEFGGDGALYVSDWVHGWECPKRGRIWRITPNGAATDPLVAGTRLLIAEGMGARSTKSLVALLDHPDQRVRLAAGLALAERGAESVGWLADVAAHSSS